MMVIEKSGYKSRMVLQIFRMGFDDFNYRYYCVAKNELQKTVGEIHVYGEFMLWIFQCIIHSVSEVDSRHVIVPFNTDQNKQQIYGILPPPKVSYEELCPPIQCTECDTKEAIKCTVGGVSFIDLISRWEVRPFQENITYPGYPPRSKGQYRQNFSQFCFKIASSVFLIISVIPLIYIIATFRDFISTSSEL